jgi:hypothetical protein
MTLIRLVCNSCGAPLEAAPSAQFLTCRFCESRLRVVHNDSTWSTEILGQVAEQTREIGAELRLARFEKELATLDQEWKDWCSENGVETLSTYPEEDLTAGVPGMRICGYLLAAGALVLAIVDNAWFLLGVPFCIAFGEKAAKWESMKASAVGPSRRRYLRERERLVSEIEAARDILDRVHAQQTSASRLA